MRITSGRYIERMHPNAIRKIISTTRRNTFEAIQIVTTVEYILWIHRSSSKIDSFIFFKLSFLDGKLNRGEDTFYHLSKRPQFRNDSSSFFSGARVLSSRLFLEVLTLAPLAVNGRG